MGVKPEIIYFDKTIYKKIWKDDHDRLHRDNKPAYIEYHTNSSISMEEWYKHGLKHRDDGPAVIHYNIYGGKSSEQWYQNGVLHRLDGPAYIMHIPNYDIVKTVWWIYGIEITNAVGYWMETNGIDINNINNPKNLMRLKLTWA